MPEIINSLFGRTRNEAATSGEDVAASPTQTQTDSTYSGGADIVVTDEAGGANAIEVKPTETETAEPMDDVATTEDVAEDTETAPSADDVAETTEADLTAADDTDDSAESADAVEPDNADDDEPAAQAAIETPAEESDEAATDEDLTQEAADEDAESAEDAPAVAETDADDVDEAAPVVAETRPAAGSRGNVTVGDGVVVKVVNIVAGKIEGVHSLDDDGISVEVEDDVATIKVSLALEFGYAIKALAERIRVDVIEAVEQFLGLDVAAVDVHVSDIHPPSAA